LKPSFNQSIEDFAMSDAERVGDESFVCLPFWFAKLVAKDAIQFVVTAADCYVGVFRLVCTVWHYRCCGESVNIREEVTTI
jgi:hypothetical protein